VNVLQAVALGAAGGNVGIALAGMARHAIDRPMRTLQRKLGGVVIESLQVRPRVFTVALVASLAELAFVRIARLVAVEAEPGRIAKLGVLNVTIAARRRLVSALQAEIRSCVIESLAIQQHDIGASAFVVGVADPAFLFRRVELVAVKASARQPVRCNLLMTFEALAGLRLPRKCGVASEALLLELGVTLDERTGHHQSLQHVL
jgi:hypothetical protein